MVAKVLVLVAKGQLFYLKAARARRLAPHSRDRDAPISITREVEAPAVVTTIHDQEASNSKDSCLPVIRGPSVLLALDARVGLFSLLYPEQYFYL
ncbi:unnamed protein product [Urochloa humidicola]